jgi:hypothetical protein
MWTLVITRRTDRATGSVSKITQTSVKGFDWAPEETDGTWTFTSNDGNWNAVFTEVVSIEETFTDESARVDPNATGLAAAVMGGI